ncbi:hypothetical protein VSDG_07099 [Cytospora chrysosperma]|uniref:CCD97-like C-terminal domain-containing protein n=1 Tax=Cytospora chrysosperma TaxID=252740 RepID=A0A423VVB6_CYTCH|nr:hypothetical protein VSDG_07099 [Valsa sordida]
MPSNSTAEGIPNQTSPLSSLDDFSRPRPRPQRSPEQAAKIRVQNRRREYLQKNPSYFDSVEHEFADPDLYDTVVRRFQTPAEREAEGRSRGWGKVLESSLMRGEARLERVASSLTGDAPPPRPPHLPSTTSSAPKTSLSEMTSGDMAAAAASVDAGLVDSKPTTKEEGRAAWEEFLRERFVAGADEEFDYGLVDGNEELDEMEHRDREEEWFDEEDPEWADDDSEGEGDKEEEEADVMMGDRRQGGAEPRKGKREKILTGQTGVQDY